MMLRPNPTSAESEAVSAAASASAASTDELSSMAAEFQLVIDNYAASSTTSAASTPVTSPTRLPEHTLFGSSSMMQTGEDGYWHSEVGIDRELERLLAENPGLVMSDCSESSEISQEHSPRYAQAEEITIHVPLPQSQK